MVVHTEQGEVEVRVRRPDARQVFLAGDFNNWDKSSLAMSRTRTGDWVCRLQLPEGVYQYRYWVDGAWYLDKTSPAVDAFPFGCHSLIVNDAQVPACPVD